MGCLFTATIHKWLKMAPGGKQRPLACPEKPVDLKTDLFLISCHSSAVFFLAGQHCCLEFCVRKGLQGLLLLTGVFYQIDLGFWEKRKFCEGAFRALSDLKFHWHADIAFLWCVKIELGGGRGGVMGALVGRTGYLKGRVSNSDVIENVTSLLPHRAHSIFFAGAVTEVFCF